MDVINKFTKKSNCNSYHNILDFENINEKKCAELDRLNEKIYKRLLTKANQAEKTIKNTGLCMNLEVPTPPHPNNRDKYIIWKKRNCKQPVIEQTEAVLFLKDNNYSYSQDYEAYQAISLANEIKKNNGIDINYKDNTKNFENVYTENDKNILRRKSMHSHNNIKPIITEVREQQQASANMIEFQNNNQISHINPIAMPMPMQSSKRNISYPPHIIKPSAPNNNLYY